MYEVRFNPIAVEKAMKWTVLICCAVRYALILLIVSCSAGSYVSVPLPEQSLESHIKLTFYEDGKVDATCVFCKKLMVVSRTSPSFYRIKCPKCPNMYLISYDGDLTRTWRNVQ